jgi:hypothetical protein
MTEDEYISALRMRWPQDCDAALEVIALADEATRFFPKSAPLWLMRGELIQLGPPSCPHPLTESLVSYERAIELDPNFADAWEEIGHYHDAVLDYEKTAQRSFQEAERLRGNQDA